MQEFIRGITTTGQERDEYVFMSYGLQLHTLSQLLANTTRGVTAQYIIIP